MNNNDIFLKMKVPFSFQFPDLRFFFHMIFSNCEHARVHELAQQVNSAKVETVIQTKNFLPTR